jgi:hypothetical protein
MRLRPERRAKRGVAVVSLWVIAALTASCSATPPATGPPPPSPVVPTHATHSAPATHPTTASGIFTVSGNNPVQVNGSQDTYAATPDATCDSSQLATDKALGREIADGFALENFPAAANLLTHFLTGTGTAVGFGIGSAISKEAAASSEFQAVNTDVQSEIALQLKAKVTRVRLSAAQLPTVLFSAKSSDLYWGFRGTQGLTVTGRGTRKNGKYVGTLTYVIRDSYGFPVDDTLAGFGPPMRYLQTVCGAPQHPGGAHWFPDTITLSVPFTA